MGTLPAQGCGFTYDGANEGHGGILATGIVSGKQLPPWLSQTHPDIVMVHLGTNDVWNNKSPTEILDAFSSMVDWMRDSKKDNEDTGLSNISVLEAKAGERLTVRCAGRQDHPNEAIKLCSVCRQGNCAEQGDTGLGDLREQC